MFWQDDQDNNNINNIDKIKKSLLRIEGCKVKENKILIYGIYMLDLIGSEQVVAQAKYLSEYLKNDLIRLPGFNSNIDDLEACDVLESAANKVYILFPGSSKSTVILAYRDEQEIFYYPFYIHYELDTLCQIFPNREKKPKTYSSAYYKFTDIVEHIKDSDWAFKWDELRVIVKEFTPISVDDEACAPTAKRIRRN